MAERRRAANVAGGRPKRVYLRLSAQEWAVLSFAADQEEMTVQRYLVTNALNPLRMPRRDYRELRSELADIRALVANIANNVNQVAKHVNTTGQLASDTDKTVRAAKELIDAITSQIIDLDKL